MNMKISAILLIALMVSLPLIRAQEQEEVIPEDIAEIVTGVGAGPAIALILDLFDTCVVGVCFDIIDTVIALSSSTIVLCIAGVFDFIDTVIALSSSTIVLCIAGVVDFIDTCVAKGLGALASPFIAFCALLFTCCGIIPWDTWLMGCWHCCSCIPCLACVPHTWSVLKSCAQLCGLY